jgi:hypothetical protein
MNISAPIRTYITQNQGRFNNVASFATAMGPNFDVTFKAMKELSKKNSNKHSWCESKGNHKRKLQLPNKTIHQKNQTII